MASPQSEKLKVAPVDIDAISAIVKESITVNYSS
jgi:hypothetical protein